MRKILMATVAVAAVAGFSAIAAAQSTDERSTGTMSPQGSAQQEHKATPPDCCRQRALLALPIACEAETGQAD